MHPASLSPRRQYGRQDVSGQEHAVARRDGRRAGARKSNCAVPSSLRAAWSGRVPERAFGEFSDPAVGSRAGAGHEKAAEALLECGAPWLIKNDADETPMRHAVERGYALMARRLELARARGVDISGRFWRRVVATPRLGRG